MEPSENRRCRAVCRSISDSFHDPLDVARILVDKRLVVIDGLGALIVL